LKFSIEQSCFIYDSFIDIPSCHSSTLVELTDGNILTAWFGGLEEAHPDAAHYKALFLKKQNKFAKAELFWNVTGKSAGNPRLFTDCNNRLWALLPVNEGKWCAGGTRTYCCQSSDNGQSWSTPLHIPELDGLLGKNKPLKMPNGNIVIPVTNENSQTSFAVIFDPNKNTWKRSKEISIGENIRCIQPTLVLLANGKIMGLLRTNIGNIWQSYSTDGGYTWSKPQKTELPNNNSGIDALKLTSGEIILAYNDTNNEKERTPLSIAVSRDEGKTWGEKFILESEVGEFSYPAVIQSSDSSIHITYTYLLGPRNTSGRNGTHIKHVILKKQQS
jgi:predicted neuraminidase